MPTSLVWVFTLECPSNSADRGNPLGHNLCMPAVPLDYPEMQVPWGCFLFEGAC